MNDDEGAKEEKKVNTSSANQKGTSPHFYEKNKKKKREKKGRERNKGETQREVVHFWRSYPL